MVKVEFCKDFMNTKRTEVFLMLTAASFTSRYTHKSNVSRLIILQVVVGKCKAANILLLRVISCKDLIFDKIVDAQDCLFLTRDIISRRFCRLRRSYLKLSGIKIRLSRILYALKHYVYLICDFAHSNKNNF